MADFNIVARLQIQLQAGSAAAAVQQLQQQLRNANLSLAFGLQPQALGGLNNLNQGLRATQAAASATSSSLRSTTQVINDGSTAIERFGAQAGLAARRFIAFTVGASTIVKVAQAFREGIAAGIDFNRTMVKIAQVGGDTKGQLAELASEVTRLSTTWGISSKELANAALVFKQAGLSAQEVKGHLETLALTDLAPNFESMAQTAEGQIAIWRQFGTNVDQTREALGAANAVAGGFAVESRDLIEAVRKSGGAFKAAGGSFNEFISLFTAVRSTTRESAAEIATGMRTIFTRIQRPQTVESLRELGVNLRYTADEAKNLGRADLENQFVGPYEAVSRLNEALRDIPTTDPRFLQVIEQLGGYRQVSRVLPMILQFSEAQKALNVAQTGSLSLTAAAEKSQESLGRRLSQVNEEFLGFMRSIVESKGFQSFVRFSLDLASALIKVLDVARPLIPVITTLAAVRIAQNFGQTAGGFLSHFIGTAPGSFTPKKVEPGVRFAKGGYVPGSGATDSVAAHVMPGEHVTKKDSTQSVDRRYPGFLTAMNQGGDIGVENYFRHRFADGGEARQGFGFGDTVKSLLANSVLGLGLLTGVDSGDAYEVAKQRSGEQVEHVQKSLQEDEKKKRQIKQAFGGETPRQRFGFGDSVKKWLSTGILAAGSLVGGHGLDDQVSVGQQEKRDRIENVKESLEEELRRKNKKKPQKLGKGGTPDLVAADGSMVLPLIEKHFDDVKQDDRGRYVTKQNNRDVFFEYMPKINALKIDFLQDGIGDFKHTNKSLQKGTLSFLRNLQGVAKSAGQKVFGIVAAGSEQKRSKIYKEGLEKLGFVADDTWSEYYKKAAFGGEMRLAKGGDDIFSKLPKYPKEDESELPPQYGNPINEFIQKKTGLSKKEITAAALAGSVAANGLLAATSMWIPGSQPVATGITALGIAGVKKLLKKRRGFAGGLDVMPDGQHESLRNLYDQVKEYAETRFSAHAGSPESDQKKSKATIAHIRRLAAATLSRKEVLQRIPAGSSIAGIGAFGVAIKTPDGDVIRAQADKAPDLANKYAAEIGRKPFKPWQYATARPPIDEVLQPTATMTVKKGERSTFMERLPYVTPLTELPHHQQEEAHEKAQAELLPSMAKKGWMLTDKHKGNLAVDKAGRFIALDPATAKKMNEDQQSRLLRILASDKAVATGLPGAQVDESTIHDPRLSVSPPSPTVQTRGRKKFDIGGEAALPEAMKLLQQRFQTFDVSRIAENVTFHDKIPSKTFPERGAIGKFYPETDEIALSRQLKSPRLLAKTLLHEFVHRIDYDEGTQKRHGSRDKKSVPGKLAAQLQPAWSEMAMQRYFKGKTKEQLTPKEQESLAYLTAPHEVLAYMVSDVATRDKDQVPEEHEKAVQTLLRRHLPARQPQKYERGGWVVPGEGNTDSFPADLAQGSYVIRKSSVQKLGASNILKMATGGTVPALLMPGEVVIPPGKARQIGRHALTEMNLHGRMPFAQGGFVRMATGDQVPKQETVKVGALPERFQDDVERMFRGLGAKVQKPLHELEVVIERFGKNIVRVVKIVDVAVTSTALPKSAASAATTPATKPQTVPALQIVRDLKAHLIAQAEAGGKSGKLSSEQVEKRKARYDKMLSEENPERSLEKYAKFQTKAPSFSGYLDKRDRKQAAEDLKSTIYTSYLETGTTSKYKSAKTPEERGRVLATAVPKYIRQNLADFEGGTETGRSYETAKKTRGLESQYQKALRTQSPEEALKSVVYQATAKRIQYEESSRQNKGKAPRTQKELQAAIEERYQTRMGKYDAHDFEGPAADVARAKLFGHKDHIKRGAEEASARTGKSVDETRVDSLEALHSSLGDSSQAAAIYRQQQTTGLQSQLKRGKISQATFEKRVAKLDSLSDDKASKLLLYTRDGTLREKVGKQLAAAGITAGKTPQETRENIGKRLQEMKGELEAAKPTTVPEVAGRGLTPEEKRKRLVDQEVRGATLESDLTPSKADLKELRKDPAFVKQEKQDAAPSAPEKAWTQPAAAAQTVALPTKVDAVKKSVPRPTDRQQLERRLNELEGVDVPSAHEMKEIADIHRQLKNQKTPVPPQQQTGRGRVRDTLAPSDLRDIQEQTKDLVVPEAAISSASDKLKAGPTAQVARQEREARDKKPSPIILPGDQPAGPPRPLFIPGQTQAQPDAKVFTSEADFRRSQQPSAKIVTGDETPVPSLVQPTREEVKKYGRSAAGPTAVAAAAKQPRDIRRIMDKLATSGLVEDLEVPGKGADPRAKKGLLRYLKQYGEEIEKAGKGTLSRRLQKLARKAPDWQPSLRGILPAPEEDTTTFSFAEEAAAATKSKPRPSKKTKELDLAVGYKEPKVEFTFPEEKAPLPLESDVNQKSRLRREQEEEAKKRHKNAVDLASQPSHKLQGDAATVPVSLTKEEIISKTVSDFAPTGEPKEPDVPASLFDKDKKKKQTSRQEHLKKERQRFIKEEGVTEEAIAFRERMLDSTKSLDEARKLIASPEFDGHEKINPYFDVYAQERHGQKKKRKPKTCGLAPEQSFFDKPTPQPRPTSSLPPPPSGKVPETYSFAGDPPESKRYHVEGDPLHPAQQQGGEHRSRDFYRTLYNSTTAGDTLGYTKKTRRELAKAKDALDQARLDAAADPTDDNRLRFKEAGRAYDKLEKQKVVVGRREADPYYARRLLDQAKSELLPHEYKAFEAETRRVHPNLASQGGDPTILRQYKEGKSDDEIRDNHYGQTGRRVGLFGGAAIGGAVGSLFGPLGTVLGGTIGAAVGQKIAKALPGSAAFEESLAEKGTGNVSVGHIAEYKTDKETGQKRLIGGDLREKGQAELTKYLAGRGPVSDATKHAFETEAIGRAEARVKRELISAQERWLKAVHPNISATEKHKLALEQVDAALAGQAKVVKSSTGRYLGVETEHTKASDLDKATGAGGVGFQFRSAKGAIGDWMADKYRSLKAGYEKFESSKAGQVLSGAGSFLSSQPVTFLAPLLGGQIEQSAGTAENAVKAGASGEGTYTTRRGIGGAATGAILGATVGSIAGPIGAAVGGAAGALVGFTSAIKDAANEIREVKIGNALTIISDRLTTIANVPVRTLPGGQATADDPLVRSSMADVLRELTTSRNETLDKNISESSGFWRSAGAVFGISNPVDVQGLAARQESADRQQVSQILPQSTQIINRQAEVLLRNNPNIGARDVARRLSTEGLTGQLIPRIAQARRVPLEQYLDELALQVAQVNTRLRAELAQHQAREGQEKVIHTFGRLVLAVQSASDSLVTLRAQAQSMSDVFYGNVTATPVTAHSEALTQLGRQDRGAIRPLETISHVVGDERGNRLLEHGRATDDVARVLPAILARVGSTNPLEPSDFSRQVREQLVSAFGGTPTGGQNAAINTVLSEIQRVGATGGTAQILREMQIDATEFTQKLINPLADPLKKFGQQVAQDLEKAGKEFTENVNEFVRRTRVAGESMDRLAALRVTTARVRAEVTAQQSGRPNDVLSQLSLQTLQSGLQSRQERLTGVVGPAASNPDFIGRQLQTVRARINEATHRQQETFELTGGRGPAYEAAALQLARLKDQAANLQNALKHLADVSERNAAAQEKLGALKQEADARIGLGERYLRADGEEMMRLNRGSLLVNQAYSRPQGQRGLDNLSVEDRRLALDWVGAARGTRLQGFQGSPLADDVHRTLIQESAGGAFNLTAGQQNEMQELQRVLLANAATAEQAQNQLITFQRESAGEFFQNLTQQHEQFFSRLEQTLARDRLFEQQNRLNEVATQQASLQGLNTNRETLQRAGVTNDDQVRNLRSNRGLVSEYMGRVSEVQALRQRSSNPSGAADIFERTYGDRLGSQFSDAGGWGINIGQMGLSSGSIGRLTENVRNTTGFTPEQTQRVISRFLQRSENITGQTGSANTRSAVTANIEEAIRREQALQSQEAQQRLAPLENNLRGRQINVGGLSQAAASGNSNALLQAIDSFDGVSNSFTTLDTRIQNTAASFINLSNSVRTLQTRVDNNNPNAGGNPFRFATGGTVPNEPSRVYRSYGTDSVPAMLTPGEFVVRAEAASANRGLLEAINRSKGGSVQYHQRGGVAYLADGGYADDEPWEVNAYNSLYRRRSMIGAGVLATGAAYRYRSQLGSAWRNTLGRVPGLRWTAGGTPAAAAAPTTTASPPTPVVEPMPASVPATQPRQGLLGRVRGWFGGTAPAPVPSPANTGAGYFTAPADNVAAELVPSPAPAAPVDPATAHTERLSRLTPEARARYQRIMATEPISRADALARAEAYNQRILGAQTRGAERAAAYGQQQSNYGAAQPRNAPTQPVANEPPGSNTWSRPNRVIPRPSPTAATTSSPAAAPGATPAPVVEAPAPAAAPRATGAASTRVTPTTATEPDIYRLALQETAGTPRTGPTIRQLQATNGAAQAPRPPVPQAAAATPTPVAPVRTQVTAGQGMVITLGASLAWNHLAQQAGFNQNVTDAGNLGILGGGVALSTPTVAGAGLSATVAAPAAIIAAPVAGVMAGNIIGRNEDATSLLTTVVRNTPTPLAVAYRAAGIDEDVARRGSREYQRISSNVHQALTVPGGDWGQRTADATASWGENVPVAGHIASGVATFGANTGRVVTDVVTGVGAELATPVVNTLDAGGSYIRASQQAAYTDARAAFQPYFSKYLDAIEARQDEQLNAAGALIPSLKSEVDAAIAQTEYRSAVPEASRSSFSARLGRISIGKPTETSPNILSFIEDTYGQGHLWKTNNGVHLQDVMRQHGSRVGMGDDEGVRIDFQNRASENPRVGREAIFAKLRQRITQPLDGAEGPRPRFAVMDRLRDAYTPGDNNIRTMIDRLRGESATEQTVQTDRHTTLLTQATQLDNDEQRAALFEQPTRLQQLRESLRARREVVAALANMPADYRNLMTWYTTGSPPWMQRIRQYQQAAVLAGLDIERDQMLTPIGYAADRFSNEQRELITNVRRGQIAEIRRRQNVDARLANGDTLTAILNEVPAGWKSIYEQSIRETGGSNAAETAHLTETMGGVAGVYTRVIGGNFEGNNSAGQLASAARLIPDDFLRAQLLPGGLEADNALFSYRSSDLQDAIGAVRQRQLRLLQEAGEINAVGDVPRQLRNEGVIPGFAPLSSIARQYLTPQALPLDAFLAQAGNSEVSRRFRLRDANNIKRENRSFMAMRLDTAEIAAALNPQAAPAPAPNANVQLARGGMVYLAQGGMPSPLFQPRGTDTIPAMLSKGEFVVNAEATKQHLPLLVQINEGRRPSYREDGGAVGGAMSAVAATASTAPSSPSLLSSGNEGDTYNLASMPSNERFLLTQTLSTLGKHQVGSIQDADARLTGLEQRSSSTAATQDNLADDRIIFAKLVADNIDAGHRNADVLVRSQTNLQKRFFLHLGGSQDKFLDKFGMSLTLAPKLAANAARAGDTNNVSMKLFRTGGVVQYYATGGETSMFQPRGSDTVPAMLSHGEFIVNAASTRHNLGLLRKINNTKGPVYYARGGLVGPAYFSEGGQAEQPQPPPMPATPSEPIYIDEAGPTVAQQNAAAGIQESGGEVPQASNAAATAPTPELPSQTPFGEDPDRPAAAMFRFAAGGFVRPRYLAQGGLVSYFDGGGPVPAPAPAESPEQQQTFQRWRDYLAEPANQTPPQIQMLEGWFNRGFGANGWDRAALRARLARDGNRLSPRWRGFFQAWSGWVGRQNTERDAAAQARLETFRRTLVPTVGGAPAAPLPPEQAEARYQAEYRRLRDIWTRGGNPLQGNLEGDDVEASVNQETTAAIAAGRANFQFLSPEQRARYRILREMQGAQVRQRTARGQALTFTGGPTADNAQGRALGEGITGQQAFAAAPGAVAEENLSPTEQAVLEEEYRFAAQDRFNRETQGLTTLEQLTQYWQPREGQSSPAFRQAFRANSSRYTPQQRAEIQAQWDFYDAYLARRPALEAAQQQAREQQRQQEAQRQREAQERETANQRVQTFRDQQAALDQEIQFQAAVNPNGGSANFLRERQAGEQFNQNMQRFNARWGELENRDRNGREEREWNRMQAQWRQVERQGGEDGARRLFVAQNAAQAHQGAAIQNLQRRQFIANAQQPFQAFGFSRPGIEGQRQADVAVLAQRQNWNQQVLLQDFNARRLLGQQPGFPVPARAFAEGGVVPGSGVHDTVPSLLTPGEYVLNRHAVQRIGVGNLHSMNHFANGGLVGGVNYLAGGGQATGSGVGINPEVAQAFSRFGDTVVQMGGGFNVFNASVQQLTSAFSIFGERSSKLTDALNNFPGTLNIQGHQTVELILNGAEVLASMQGDLQALVQDAVKTVVRERLGGILSDAGVQLE